MAFHEVRFPDDIAWGVTGGPKFKTGILDLSSGFEHRNIDWQDARAEYLAAYGLKDQDELNVLLAFFYTRRGRAHGFRFKDWTDFKIGTPGDSATAQRIALGDDSTTVFQLFKRYTSGGVDYDRPMEKISADLTTEVYLDASLQTITTHYTLDVNTGILTMVTAPASTGGTGPGSEEDLTVILEYDVPVRFDVDHMRTEMEFFEGFEWEGIPLVQVREIT